MFFADDIYGAGAAAQADQLGSWDVAADLTLRARVDSESWLKVSQAPITLGYEGAEMALTWAVPNHRYAQYQHWSRYIADPLRPFGLTPDYDVTFAGSDAKATFAERKWAGRPRVLIIPGGRRTDNCWPPELFSAVGRQMHERLGASVVLVGAPDEEDTLTAMKPAIGPGTDLYTGRSMTELIALMKSADVVVSNDTGPMHFAYLLKKPTVAAFKTMSPLCWGPPAPDPRFVVFDYTMPQSIDPKIEDVAAQMANAAMAQVSR